MTWDSAPWMVKGARHAAEVGRLLAYVATRGNEGIINPTDLKVLPLAVPGNQVRVSPGAAVILNRYANSSWQSYAGRNPTDDLSPTIVATGAGSGRSDLIVARVEDPQYPGTTPPASPLDANYIFTRVIQGVPAGTTRATELNLGYPALALARLDIPASTAAITSGMIVDLRKVANPRREKGSGIYYPSADITMSKVAYANWPFTVGSAVNVNVPEWATGIEIRCSISGAEITGAAGAMQAAGLRTVFDGVASTQHQALIGYGPVQRPFVQVIGKHDISAAQRGTTRIITTQGVQSEGVGAIKADYQTTISLEWEFTEAAA